MPLTSCPLFMRPSSEPPRVTRDVEKNAAQGEAPLAVILAIVVTATGTVALFFFPDLPLELALQLAGGSE